MQIPNFSVKFFFNPLITSVSLLWTPSNLATWSQNTMHDLFFLIFFLHHEIHWHPALGSVPTKCWYQSVCLQHALLTPQWKCVNMSSVFGCLPGLTWTFPCNHCTRTLTCSVRVWGNHSLNGERWRMGNCSHVSIASTSDKELCLSHQ